jgi:hypothetical protein
MSEHDLPARLSRYGGNHVVLNRIALVREQLTDLPSFPAADKRSDSRYGWFVRNYGKRCWELDALDPNDPPHLRRREHQRVYRTNGVGSLQGRGVCATRLARACDEALGQPSLMSARKIARLLISAVLAISFAVTAQAAIIVNIDKSAQRSVNCSPIMALKDAREAEVRAAAAALIEKPLHNIAGGRVAS